MSDNGYNSAPRSRGRYVLDLNVVFQMFHVLCVLLFILLLLLLLIGIGHQIPLNILTSY